MISRTWMLCAALTIFALFTGVASAQTAGDFHMQLVTGTGSSDSNTTPSVTITTGSTGAATINIIPLDGFNQSVSFSCVGMPANSSCTFNPTTVTPNVLDAATWTTTMTIATTASYSARVSPVRNRWLAMSGFAIAGVLFVLPYGGRRRRAASALMLFTLMAIISVAGCGGSSSTPSNQVQPGTYSVVVNSKSGELTHSANLSIIVTK